MITDTYGCCAAALKALRKRRVDIAVVPADELPSDETYIAYVIVADVDELVLCNLLGVSWLTLVDSQGSWLRDICKKFTVFRAIGRVEDVYSQVVTRLATPDLNEYGDILTHGELFEQFTQLLPHFASPSVKEVEIIA